MLENIGNIVTGPPIDRLGRKLGVVPGANYR